MIRKIACLIIASFIFAAVVMFAPAAYAVTEFVSTIAPSGGDYTTLALWQASNQVDLTGSTVVLSHSGITGSIPDGAYVKGATSGAYGTVVHCSATQILIKGVVGTFTYSIDAWTGTTTTEIINVTTTLNGAVAGTGSIRNTSAQDSAISVAKIDGTWTSADTTPLVIDGWTTSATNYIKIYTTTTARHNGKPKADAYRLEVTAAANNTYAIDIKEENVRISGLQVKLTNSGGYTGCRAINVDLSASADIRINGNIINGSITNTNSAGTGIYVNGASTTGRIYNNLVYGFINGTTLNTYGITIAGGTSYLYNNTIYGNYRGIYVAGGTVVAKNNLSYNNTTDYVGTFDAESVTNISKDATSPNGASYQNKTVVFVDEAGFDFSLATEDTAAKDTGTDLTSDANIAFYDDLAGGGRGGVWDIGSDEQGTNLVISANTTWPQGTYSYDDVIIANNATLTVQSNTTTGLGSTLNFRNLKVEAGSTISANGQGYTYGTGTGKGTNGTQSVGAGGGGYGGVGGAGSGSTTNGGTAYGTLKAPTDLGSPGGDSYNSTDRGGSGGGAIKINLSGTSAVINGTISSNGNNGTSVTYPSAGGSGGSIWINFTASGNISGSGVITANGGNRYNTKASAGGGAGGRIAITGFGTNSLATANIRAYGGEGYQPGGAGTIYLKSAAQTNGDLYVSNNNRVGGGTPLLTTGGGPNWEFDNMLAGITNGAILYIPSGATLNHSLTTGTISGTAGTVLLNSGGIISAPNLTGLTIAGTLTINTGSTFSLGALDSLTVSGTFNNYLSPHVVSSLSVTGTINNYGTITYSGTSWTLAGTFVNQTTASAVFTANSLTDLTVSGTLTINSLSTINVGNLANVTVSGTFTNAKILPTLTTFVVSTGGTVNNSGTIPISATSWTLAGTFNNTGTFTASSLTDITINGTLSLGGTYTFSTSPYPSLTINSGGTLTQPTGSTANINLNLATLNVASGGSINLDGKGGSTSGAGASDCNWYQNGGGAGHGGNGGSSNTGEAGGAAYGSISAPVTTGSAGGSGSYTSCIAGTGGAGGGAIKLNVSGTATINGTISANGTAGTQANNWGGGGSGGSIWIIADTLEGTTGVIRVNGGTGAASYSGGGGGGRICLEYTTANNYSGSKTAYGGVGNVTGGAGTIFIKATSATYGELYVNNNGQSGAYTTLPSGTYQFSNNLNGVTNGGQVQFASGATWTITDATYTMAGNFILASGATFSAPNLTALTVSGNATFSSGSTFSPNASFNSLTVSGTFTNYLVLPTLTTFAVTGTVNNYGTIVITHTSWTLAGTVNNFNGATFTASSLTTFNLNGTFSIGGTCTFPSNMDLSIGGTGVLTHGTNTTSKVYYIDLTLNSLTIASGGSINVNAKGFAGGNGSGAGVTGVDASPYYYGGGGAYGGNGGKANYTYSTYGNGGTAYGTLKQPTDLGSGGGACVSNGTWAGGSGGGAIKLTVAGTTTVNGTISANGGNYYSTSYPSGGGSGGSIWIITPTLSGTGSITATGGLGYSTYSGAGGGGRVAIEYTTWNFSGGSWSVAGGSTGYQKGGAGTFYLKSASSTNGTLYMSNGGLEGAYTPLLTTGGGPTWQFDNNLDGIGGSANLLVSSGVTLNVSGSTLTIPSGGIVTNSGTINAASATTLTVAGSLYLYPGTTFTNSLTTITVNGTFAPMGSQSFSNAAMTINSGGTVTHLANSNTKTYYIDMSLASLNIVSGGSINVAGKGYAGGYGTGAGAWSTSQGSGGGGGYGGVGGVGAGPSAGGITYGIATAPSELGSGGGGTTAGGAGGGAIKLNVTGTVTVNGTITANGNNYVGSYGGGGAGGSVWVIANTFSGITGAISTNGGNGYYFGGGGGGGRIMIDVVSYTYTGTMTKTGGTGSNPGGAGTLYPAPTATISVPAKGTRTNSVTTISGTAFALTGTLQSPQVSIKDLSTGTWFNGTTAFDQVSEQWFGVTGAAIWSYTVSNDIWTSGRNYLIRARVSNGTDTGTPSENYIYFDSEAPNAPTGVTFTPVGGTIISNALNETNTNFTVSANITAGNATGGYAELLKNGASFSTPIYNSPSDKYILYYVYSNLANTSSLAYQEGTDGNAPAAANLATRNWLYTGSTTDVNDRAGGFFILPLASGKYRVYYTYNNGTYNDLAFRDTVDTNPPSAINLGARTIFYLATSTSTQVAHPFILRKADNTYRMYYSYNNGTYWALAYRDTTDTNPPSTSNLGSQVLMGIATSASNQALDTYIVRAADNTYRIYYSYNNGTYWQIVYRNTTDTNPPSSTNLDTNHTIINIGYDATHQGRMPSIIQLPSTNRYRLYYSYYTGTYYYLAYKETSDTNLPALANLGSEVLLNIGSSATDSALCPFALRLNDRTIRATDASLSFDAGLASNAEVQAAFASDATLTVSLRDKVSNATASAGTAINADYVKPTVTIAVSNDPCPSLAAGVLEFTLNFNEAMDTSVSPTVTYDPAGSTGAQSCSGSWTNNTTFVATNNNAINTSTGDGTATISVSAARDAAGNVMTADTNDTFEIDSIAPNATNLAWSPGADATDDVLIMTFDKAMGLPGTVSDYTIMYDPDNILGNANDRSISAVSIANAGADTSIEITIPDQSQFTDATDVGVFRVTAGSGVRDTAGNSVNAANNTETVAVSIFDSIAPRLTSTMAYATGENGLNEVLTLTFSEAMGTVGTAANYTIVYDPNGIANSGDERSVTAVSIANEGGNNTIEVTIPDQSSFLDAGASGLFRVTVGAGVKDMAGNDVDVNYNTATVSVTNFDTVIPQISATTFYANDNDRRLVITCTEVIDKTPITNVDLSKFHIRETGATTGGVTLTGATVTAGDSNTITITTTIDQRLNIQALATRELDVDAGAYRDLVGNLSVASANNAITYVADTKAPVLSTVSAQSRHGQGDIFTLTFDEPMDATTLTNALVQAGTIHLYNSSSATGTPSVSVPQSNATVAWSNGVNGTNTIATITLDEVTDSAYMPYPSSTYVYPRVHVPAATVRDVAGNAVEEVYVIGSTFSGETTKPALTVTTLANTSGDSVIIASDEVLTGAAATRSNWTIYSDTDNLGLAGNETLIPITNATITLSANKRQVTIVLNPVADSGAYLRNGEYIYVVPNSTNIRDLIGNANVSAVYTASPVTGDTQAPIVNSVAGSSIHGAGDRVILNFSEPMNVSTLSNSNIATNLAIYTIPTMGVPTSGDRLTLTHATVSWSNGAGGTNSVATIVLDKDADRAYIPNGYIVVAEPQTNSIRDLAGNYAAQSYYYTGSAVTGETTVPGITFTTPAANTRVNNASVVYTLDESIASGTITWNGQTQVLTGNQLYAGAHNVTFAPALVSGTTYTVTVNATDFIGNTNSVAHAGVLYDMTGPSITSATVVSSNSNPTRARAGDTITYTFNYSESVTASVTNASRAAHIAGVPTQDLHASGATTDTIVFTVASGDNGVVSLSNINFTLTDLANNTTTYTDPASITGLSVVDGLITADTTLPTVTVTNNLTANTAGELAAGALQLTLNFSEPMNTSISPTVTYDPNGAVGAQTCTGSWTNNTTFVVTNENAITPNTGDGSAVISITGARDIAGNTMAANTSNTFNILTTRFTITGIVDTSSGVVNMTTAGVSQTITVTAVDTNGTPRTTYTGSVILTSSDTAAVLPIGAQVFSASDNGVRTFTGVELRTVGSGTQTITATDAANSSIVGSVTVTVNPDVTASYVVTPATATITAGTRTGFTVRRYDRFNNLQTREYSDYLTLATTNTTLAKRSFQNQAGQAISTIRINNGASSAQFWYYDESATGGTPWIITVRDNTLNLSDTSDVTVNTGAPAKFKITSSVSGTVNAGAAIPITITAYDSYDNLTTSYGGTSGAEKTVVFSGADPSADPVTAPTANDSAANPIAFGENTVVIFTNGVASTNLRLYRAQGVAIKVSAAATAFDAAMATAATDDLELVVQGGDAGKLSWYTQPNTTVVARAPWRPFSVSVADAYGNVASGTVNITVTPSGAVASTGSTNSVNTVSGIATFSNFRAESVDGTYPAVMTLTASATLSSGTPVSSSASNSVTISEKYAMILYVKDSVTLGNMQGVSVTIRDSNGALVDLTPNANPWVGNSPFSDQFYLPYGTFSVTLEKDEYVQSSTDLEANTTNDYNSDSAYNNTVVWNTTMTSIAESMADYKVLADFLYDETSDVLTITQRLERRSQQKLSDGLNNLGVATIEIYDGATLIGTLTNATPDAQGNYWYSITGATASAPAGFTTAFTRGKTYYAKCKIGYGGVAGDRTTYASATTFNITVTQSLKAVTDTLATMSTDIQTQVSGVKTTVASEAATTRERVSEVKSETARILTAAQTTIPEKITAEFAKTTAQLTTIQKSEILNRDSVVMLGSTISIRFRTYPGVIPTITVYDPNNLTRVSAMPMAETSEGLYAYDVTFAAGWPRGDYSIICAEATHNVQDAIVISAKSTDLENISSDLSAVVGQVSPVRDMKSKIDAFSSAFNIIEDNLQRASEALAGVKTGTAEAEAAAVQLDSVFNNLKDMSQKIHELGATVGYDLEKLYDVNEARSKDINYIRNKTQELKALLLMSQQLMEGTAKEEPVVQTWFEFR